MSQWDDFRNQVTGNGGVMTVNMGHLRNLVRAGKLGVYVVEEISKELGKAGLGHAPAELPTYQERNVLIYRLSTPLADWINAVVHPSPETDHLLTENDSGSAGEIVAKIRELVCGDK